MFNPANKGAADRKGKPSLNTIHVNVSLYGSISKYLGGTHVAMKVLEVPEGASKGDLLREIGIQESERGYLFINAVLCDVPGLNTGDGQLLKDGDHLGVFSIDRIWPYQYRDGVNMSPELVTALKKHGAMHHSYSHLKDNESNPSTIE